MTPSLPARKPLPSPGQRLLFCLLRAVVLLAFLPPIASGCGSGSTRHYSTDLSDNYLGEITPALWRKRQLLYDVRGGSSPFPGVDVEGDISAGVDSWRGFPGLPTWRRSRAGETPDVVFTFGNRDETEASLGRTWPDVDNTLSPPGLRFARVVMWRSLLPSQRRRVAAHEWGHVLGIRGHPETGNALMTATVPRDGRPTQRDYATVVLMYQMLGGVNE